jgi:hypothetical protein
MVKLPRNINKKEKPVVEYTEYKHTLNRFLTTGPKEGWGE